MKKILLLFAVFTFCMFLYGCKQSDIASSSEIGEKNEITCVKIIKENNEIEVSDEINKKIMTFYYATDIQTEKQVDSAFLGYMTIDFSDGTELIVDENDDEIALLKLDNTSKIIIISSEFKNYLLAL
ncbi:MAG: hypothetical protein E7496_10410 [Ruminococcus sp.]|nr:hypothetical protein [Ruminococcus sp.]